MVNPDLFGDAVYTMDTFELEVLAAIAFTCVLYLWTKKRTLRLPLPPGPKGLPLLGNALSLPKSYEWIVYHNWCQELNTDLIHLDLMGQSLIILDTASVIGELLERRSAQYSSRPKSPLLSELVGLTDHLALLEYGVSWRHQRREAQRFMNVNAYTNYKPHVLFSVRRLMMKLLDQPKDIMKELEYMTAGAIMTVCYGIDISTEEGALFLETVRKGNQALFEAVSPGKFLVDVFPILKHVPAWMPGAGFQRKAAEWKQAISDMTNLPFQAVRRNMDAGTCSKCFCCTALRSDGSDSEGVDPNRVKHVAMSLYSAGADITCGVLGSCILGLLSRPEIMERARKDLDRVIRPGSLPDFNDEKSLPFITAIAKESLRWRTVGPLGVPHLAEVEDEYNGYRIPAGSILMANQWALLHDKAVYEDPFTFKPERFMKGDEYNHAMKDPESACFGFGRRICVGRHMAFSTIWLTVASLIYTFDIGKATDENGRVIEPDPTYSLGETIYAPGPFPCSITPRSREYEELIRAGMANLLDEA